MYFRFYCEGFACLLVNFCFVYWRKLCSSTFFKEAEESALRKEAKIVELMRENELLRNDSRLHVDSNDDLASALEKFVSLHFIGCGST